MSNLSIPWAVAASAAPPEAAAASPAPAVALRDVELRYGSTVALAGVSLDVRRGETFGLLGPNGAGKTSLMHVLVGARVPQRGSISLAGRGAPSTPEVRRLLGIAPQALALYRDLTAEENLRFFARLQGLVPPRLNERVDWALELAGLSDRRRDRIGTFSGGMQRRLNLACALVHGPEIVLLDEPTVGVDPQSRDHLLSSLEVLAGTGLTVIYSTHYMEEASRLCDRVAIVDAGRLLAVGRPAELVQRYGGGARLRLRTRGPLPEVGLEGAVSGCEIDQRVRHPAEVVAQVLAAGAEIERLSVEEADLEQVFFALTGRSLRD